VLWILSRLSISTVAEHLERVPLLRRIIASPYANRAVIGGGITTVLAMQILHSIPGMIDFEEFRRTVFRSFDFYFLHDPFSPLPFLGGIIGGYVAGYLTRNQWYTAIRNGIIAIICGVFVYYLTVVGREFIALVSVEIVVIDAIIIATFQPLFFLFLPFSLLYFGQAVVTSVIGNSIYHFLDKKYSAENFKNEENMPSETWLLIYRSSWALFILIILFSSTWGFIFLTGNTF
jgi:hypothetical protein